MVNIHFQGPLYFTDTFLSTQLRRSTEFFYYYGFTNISLTLLRIDPNQYGPIDVTKMEQYFIDTLHSELNVIRDVFVLKMRHYRKKVSLLRLHQEKWYLSTFIISAGGAVLNFFSVLNLKDKHNYLLVLPPARATTIKKAIETGSFYRAYFFITTTPIQNATTESQLTMEEFMKVRVRWR